MVVSSFSSCEALLGAEILGEMGECAHHGVGGKPAQRAKRSELHGVAEIFEHQQIRGRGSRPATILSTSSTPRAEPMRQGVHLPQDSMAQNSMAKRACLAMSTVSSNTTMPPWPISPSRGGEGLVVERRVEQRAREIGAERAADLHGAHRPARCACRRRCRRRARRGVMPNAVSNSPPCLMLPASWIGMVPRDRPMPKSR